jgi:hypothetical protein
VSFGAYLSLWHITDHFKWIYDYDEGAYSLGAKFINSGSVPYRDFTLVHPPFYDFMLSLVYRVFGYNFFYGRYLSVSLFLTSVILIFLTLKKLYRPTAGLVGAATLVLFPGFTLLWYRTVQEALGITLVLAGIYFALDYVLTWQRPRRLLLTGIFLGLALATKYTFLLSTLPIVCAIVVLSFGQVGRRISFAPKGIAFLTSGIIVGFLTVVGFFLVRFPTEFLAQTFSAQVQYRVSQVPNDVISRMTTLFRSGTVADKLTVACVAAAVVVLVLMIVRRTWSRPNIFITIVLSIALPASFALKPFGEIRYFAPAFLFAVLGFASFTFDTRAVLSRFSKATLRESMGAVLISFALLVCLVGRIMQTRDFNYVALNKTYEGVAYEKTVDYLVNHGAKKIYSFNPMISALCPSQVSSTPDFDAFGLLLPMRDSPQSTANGVLSESPDFLVFDVWGYFSSLRDADVRNFITVLGERSIEVTNITNPDMPLFSVTIREPSQPQQ